LNHDEEHIDIREKLLKLPKIKAGENFHNSLLTKINLLEAESLKNVKPLIEAPNEGFFLKLFGSLKRPWLAVSYGFGVIIIVVFFAFYIVTRNSDTTSKQSPVITTENTDTKTQTGSDPEGKNLADSKKEETKKELPGKELKTDYGNLNELRNPSPTTKRYDERGDVTANEKIITKENILVPSPKSDIKPAESISGLVTKDKLSKTDDKEKKAIDEKKVDKNTETIKVESSKDQSGKEQKNIGQLPSVKDKNDKETSKGGNDDSRKSESNKRNIKGINEIDKSTLEKLRDNVKGINEIDKSTLEKLRDNVNKK